MSNTTNTLPANVKKVMLYQNSFKQYDGNTMVANVTVTMNDESKFTCHCATQVNKDAGKIEAVITNESELIMEDELIEYVKKTMMEAVGWLRNVCNKKGTDPTGEFKQPYYDSHISVDEYALEQYIKIGSLIVKATRNKGETSYVLEYKAFGNLLADWRPVEKMYGWNDDASDLQKRIDKQLVFGIDKSENARWSKPVGFQTWGQVHQYKKSIGQHVGYSTHKRAFGGR